MAKVELPLVEKMSWHFNIDSFSTTLHSILNSSSIFFTNSNAGNQWSLDFSPDSVTLTVKNLLQDLTKSSQEHFLPAWNLLLSQKQEDLDNHLAQIPITHNQQGIFETKEKVLVTAGVQDMTTRGYEL